MLEEQNQENETVDNIQYQSQNLNKGQKAAIAVLAFFSLVIVIGWMISFKKSISEPFNRGGSTNVSQDVGGNTQIDTESDLKNKDTDGDGLSDWDELNIYKTSPYLEDSDSDGFEDGQEIDSENDPNCPTGRDCYGESVPTAEIVKTESQQAPTPSSVPVVTPQTATTENSQNADIQKVLSGQTDAQSLREMLIGAGMDQNMLDQISDEDLMSSYKETLAK